MTATEGKRVAVVGASSGLGRCVGVGLAKDGDRVALMARRLDRLEEAAAEAGAGAIAIACDVTDEKSCRSAMEQAAEQLGGLDAVVYTPAIGPLVRIENLDAETWRRTLDTNVIGPSLVMSAALPFLRETHGRVVVFSSVSGSFTAPWPGLAAYSVSKAALERLVASWRAEHTSVEFTTLIVGDCAGDLNNAAGVTEFANGWDQELAAELAPTWTARGLTTLGASLLDVDELIRTVGHLVRLGPTASMPELVLTARPPA